MDSYYAVSAWIVNVYRTWMVGMKYFLFIALCCFLFLTACSPQRRLARLVKKHPELLTKDTLSFRDTVVIPGVEMDTAVLLSALKDTVTLIRDSVITRVWLRNDSVFIETLVKPDTVIRVLKVPYEKILIKNPTFWQQVKPFLALALLVLIGMYIRSIILKRGNS